MSDIEFIAWLVKLLWDDVTDGNTPDSSDFEIIKMELEKRGLNPDELMGY